MQGQPNIQVEFASSTSVLDAEHIPVLYEDNYLAVVEKPAGVLSVPGKTATRSVRDWAAEHWPNASGPLLVHRLDMDTSGVLLIAKDHRSQDYLIVGSGRLSYRCVLISMTGRVNWCAIFTVKRQLPIGEYWIQVTGLCLMRSPC